MRQRDVIQVIHPGTWTWPIWIKIFTEKGLLKPLRVPFHTTEQTAAGRIIWGLCSGSVAGNTSRPSLRAGLVQEETDRPGGDLCRWRSYRSLGWRTCLWPTLALASPASHYVPATSKTQHCVNAKSPKNNNILCRHSHCNSLTCSC